MNSSLNFIGTNTFTGSSATSLDARATNNALIQGFTNVHFAAGSVTVIGEDMVKSGTPLIDGGKVTVDSTAHLDITNIVNNEGGNTYTIADNYDEDNSSLWTTDNFVYDRMDNFVTGKITEDGKFEITVSDVGEENAGAAADEMAKALDAGALSDLFKKEMLGKWDGVTAGSKAFIEDWQLDTVNNKAYQAGVLVGEDSAVTGNTVSLTQNVGDEVAHHVSFTSDSIQGDDTYQEGNTVWATYVHNTFKTDGMSSNVSTITADNDYDGAIVGLDFAKRGNLQTGIAFHYGDGTGTGAFTKNDYDAWGVSLYGAWENDERHTNLVLDLGYTKTSNDITSTINEKALTADRDVTAWTIGLRGEKEYISGHSQIVPYVGLRYMNVDPSSYTSTFDGKEAFHYTGDNQDLWMLPIGVSFRNETTTNSGWSIVPKVDLAYIWAFGDTDMTTDINMGTSSTAPLTYTVMDEGSWLASAGIDATYGDWTFGTGYTYQKGDDTKNDKWYVNLGFHF